LSAAASSPDGADWGLPRTPECPFCGGTDTELHSPFGSAASVATYWCANCRTAFEHIKWMRTERTEPTRTDETPDEI
jgi:hypothetical protein